MLWIILGFFFLLSFIAGNRLKARFREYSRIALPNGMNVHPEDVEAALVAAGLVEPVVYDAGALIAAERNDRRFWAEHRVRLELGIARSLFADE